MSQSNSSTKSFLIIFGILFTGIVLFFIFIAFIISIAGGKHNAFKSAISDNNANIAVVSLTGIIQGKMSDTAIDNLITFAKDKDIKAIILRINSPGGSVSESQELMNAVVRVREKYKKPVVVSMGALAASGGYYAACAADYIMANPGTITGSIGVIMETTYMKDLMNWAKMEPVIYKSGKFKDMGSPFRHPTDDERALLNSIIQDIYGQFVQDVSKYRNIPLEELKKFADGRIITGRNAVELKLVDGLGSFYDTIDKAAELAKLEEKPVLRYPSEDNMKYLEKLLKSSISEGIWGAIHSNVPLAK